MAQSNLYGIYVSKMKKCCKTFCTIFVSQYNSYN